MVKFGYFKRVTHTASDSKQRFWLFHPTVYKKGKDVFIFPQHHKRMQRYRVGDGFVIPKSSASRMLVLLNRTLIVKMGKKRR